MKNIDELYGQETKNLLMITDNQTDEPDVEWYIAGLSNFNQPQAAHLSVRSEGGSCEFYRFSWEFCL